MKKRLSRKEYLGRFMDVYMTNHKEMSAKEARALTTKQIGNYRGEISNENEETF